MTAKCNGVGPGSLFAKFRYSHCLKPQIEAAVAAAAAAAATAVDSAGSQQHVVFVVHGHKSRSAAIHLTHEFKNE